MEYDPKLIEEGKCDVLAVRSIAMWCCKRIEIRFEPLAVVCLSGRMLLVSTPGNKEREHVALS